MDFKFKKTVHCQVGRVRRQFPTGKSPCTKNGEDTTTSGLDGPHQKVGCRPSENKMSPGSLVPLVANFGPP